MQEELERLLNSSGSTVAEVIQPTQGGPVLPVVYEIRSLISQLYTKTCQAKVSEQYYNYRNCLKVFK